MWRAVASLVCAVLVMALPAPALAQTSNGQLAVVLQDRIVAVNADGTGLRPLYTPPSGDPIRDRRGPRTATNSRSSTRTRSRAGPRHPVGDVVDDAGRGGARRRPGVVGGRREHRLPARRAALIAASVSDAASRQLAGGSVGAHGPVDVRVRLCARIRRLAPTGSATAALRLDTRRLPARQRRDRTRPPGRRTAAQARLRRLGGASTAPGLRDLRIVAARRKNRKRRRPFPAAAPRWAPDGGALVVPARRQVIEGAGPTRTHAPVVVPGIAGATAVDWQPCTSGKTTVGCRSVLGADLQRGARAGDDGDRPARQAARSAVHRSGRAAAAARAGLRRRPRQRQRLGLHPAARVRRAGLGHLPGEQRQRRLGPRARHGLRRPAAGRRRSGAVHRTARRPRSRRRS